MSNPNTRQVQNLDPTDDDDMLDEAEAEEEILDDGDAAMDSDPEEDHQEDQELEEVQLQNDSIAHFDAHEDSVFCIARHPIHANIIATGGGDELAYVFDSTPSRQSTTTSATDQSAGREGLHMLFKAVGHTDSVNAITFSYPSGAYLLTAGLDGRLRAYRDTTPSLNGRSWAFLAEAQEVEEINFLIPCPNPTQTNIFALGASDGSVWVYKVNAADKASPLTILQAFYLHTDSCTAGAWTPDGKLLATVSQDGSFYVWDVFGDAAASGLVQPTGQQSVVGLTSEDERFRVDGGLYSVAISPGGAFAAVGGAEGHIRIVGLPRLASAPTQPTTKSGKGKANGVKGAGDASSSSQAGILLASLQTQSDSIETIAFSAPPLTLMATGSVDGSVVLFDTARRFAVRRKIEDAHQGDAVIKVEFLEQESWMLATCGNDGVLRRWDTRGGTAAAASGFAGEWKGHQGGGVGGIMGFVQLPGGKVVTAGDDGVSLVFDMSKA